MKQQKHKKQTEKKAASSHSRGGRSSAVRWIAVAIAVIMLLVTFLPLFTGWLV